MVSIVDALDFTSPLNKRVYRQMYTLLVTKFPWAWKFFFFSTDQPCLRPAIRSVRRIFNGFGAHALEQFLIKEQFDCIASTHFFPNEVLGRLKRSGRIRSRIVSIITDFDVHSIWLGEGIDRYAVACDYTLQKLLSLGIPAEKVTVTGIPTHAKFREPLDRTALQKKFGLKRGAFTILVATGSFGMGPIEMLVSELKDFQMLIVCGNNQELFEKLSLKNLPGAKVFGLVDFMHELMTVADVMITKPGGMSIAEAMVKHLPMIFFSAIPGQETNNVRVLRNYGIGISGHHLEHIIIELRRLISSEDELRAACRNLAQLAHPEAASAIVRLIR